MNKKPAEIIPMKGYERYTRRIPAPNYPPSELDKIIEELENIKGIRLFEARYELEQLRIKAKIR